MWMLCTRLEQFKIQDPVGMGLKYKKTPGKVIQRSVGALCTVPNEEQICLRWTSMDKLLNKGKSKPLPQFKMPNTP